MYEELKEQAKKTTEEICDKAGLKEGNILVVGCFQVKYVEIRLEAILTLKWLRQFSQEYMKSLKAERYISAAQCCEHLNRAIIVERAAVPFSEIVNVVPQPKAGGSFGTTAYKTFKDPVAVEEIKADGGIDIGGTLIGMHIKKVAVPVRLENNKIGEANVLAARTRPKFIGGCRAVYDESIE